MARVNDPKAMLQLLRKSKSRLMCKVPGQGL